ncbi:hypothetical protein [Mucilaginibacter terrae]|uniref:Arm DNA-binding domain-containing protein n=1 Tax=Mucilaginibacter terrae TaxID=1955052 RepID=A0ABU3GWZ3_9SPHI|nr:hypothetical protein [Mucilaginibacter terrae]MDT3404295.1 hypothetical protein [Mucilaginibacter terrae]
MATVSAKILKHHKKTDGTFNVKICISHKRDRSFIDTEFYVTEKQLKKDRSIRDQFILSCVNKSLDTYRRAICDNDELIGRMTASDIKDFLLKKDKKIDFLNYSDQHIKLLIDNDQEKVRQILKPLKITSSVLSKGKVICRLNKSLSTSWKDLKHS